MRFLFALIVASAFGQTVLEDWACGTPQTITNSNPARVQCAEPHGLSDFNNPGTHRTQVIFSGASGSWAPLNRVFQITVISPSQFSIPLDTTAFGAYPSGISFVRANWDGVAMFRTGFSGIDANTATPISGALRVTIPLGFTSTANTKYCNPSPVDGLDVVGGIASVVLERPFFHDPARGYDATTGREFHFRNTSNAALNSMRWTNQGPDRPHYIDTIDPSRTRFTANVAAPDGNYVQGNTDVVLCPPNTFNFIIHPRLSNGFPFPSGRIAAVTKSGAISAATNRMVWRIRPSKSWPRRADGGWTGSIGTYVKDPGRSDPRAEYWHFYHYLAANLYAGEEITLIFNNTVQHSRSAVGNAFMANNPTVNGWPFYSSPSWDFKPVGYFEGMTYFYIDHDMRDVSVDIGPIVFGAVAGESDAYVSNLSIVYAAQRFGSRGPGFEVAWAMPKGDVSRYRVRYSDVGSIKQLGWSSPSAIDGGIVTGTGSVYTGLIWYSPQLPHKPLWVAIRPEPVVVAAGGGATTWLTTRTESGLAVGEDITASGVNAAVNGIRRISGVQGWGLWQTGHGFLGVTVAAGVATASFSGDHNLQTGQRIEVCGSTNSALGGASCAGRNNITVIAPDKITFPAPNVADGTYTTDLSATSKLSLRSYPAIEIPVPWSGTYAGGGSIVPIDERLHISEISIGVSGPVGTRISQRQVGTGAGTIVTQNQIGSGPGTRINSNQISP